MTPRQKQQLLQGMETLVLSALVELKSAALKERERDSVAAAAILEDAVAAAEKSRSIKGTSQDCAPPVELAQQLSAEATAVLDVLTKYAGAKRKDARSFPYDTVWLLVRPVLRVLLWLLPQHVMQAGDGRGASSSSNCIGVAYVSSVATVPLVQGIKSLILIRDNQKHWGDFSELRADTQSYALMEEFLFWVAVLHRLHTLAYELQLDLAPSSIGRAASAAAQPSPAPPAAAVSSPAAAAASRNAHAFCIAVWLMLADHISSIVLFMSEKVLACAIEHLESLTSCSKHAATLAFATSYVPSEHVVSAVGVWGRLLEVASHAADIVAALPTPQLLRRHYSTNYPSSVHAKMLLVMQHASHLLKLRHVMPPYMSRDKLLGSLRGLGPLTQKHLRGLMLSFLEDPVENDLVDPLSFVQLMSSTVGITIQPMITVLAINVHGADVFEEPKKFPKHMLNIVLKHITTAGKAHAHPKTALMLPPSPLDGQHLEEWKEAADYAATTLAMVVGIVDIETGFKSPFNLAGMYDDGESARQRSNVVKALCYLLDAVKPLTSSHFLQGAPGSRAYSACLAVISAALCFDQQRMEQCVWDGADAAAWELVLGRVLPRLRDLQEAAQPLAMGGVRGMQKQQQQQQQQEGDQGQGSQHRGQADPGEGDRHTSPAACAQQPRRSGPAAAGSGGDVAQADARPALCPPADLALLLLMAAARTVKAGVNFHCYGGFCDNCDFWHPRQSVGDDSGSDQGDEGEDESSSGEGGEHHRHKGQRGDSHDGLYSLLLGLTFPAPEQPSLAPGLKDLDQLEEALDILLTLVHCLVGRGAWWQQAVSQQPLLLLQVLLTVADVLSDITVNLLTTTPYEGNVRLLERCCSTGGGPAHRAEDAARLPREGSSADHPEGIATARRGGKAAGMGLLGSVQGRAAASTPGTQTGTSQAGSTSDQAGGCAGVSHNSQVDHSRHTSGSTSSSCTEPSQATGSNGHSCSRSATSTGEGLSCRPNITQLLTLVDECLMGVLTDPAVMGAAQQPAAWMPDKSSLRTSMACRERMAWMCFENAMDAALFQGLLQQDMRAHCGYQGSEGLGRETRSSHHHQDIQGSTGVQALQLVRLVPTRGPASLHQGARESKASDNYQIVLLHLRVACVLSQYSAHFTEAHKDQLALLLGGAPGGLAGVTLPTSSPSIQSDAAPSYDGEGDSSSSVPGTPPPATPPSPGTLPQPGQEQAKARREFALGLLCRKAAYVQLPATTHKPAAPAGNESEASTAEKSRLHSATSIPVAGALALALSEHRVPHLVELYEQWKEAGHDALVAAGSRLTPTTPQYWAHLEWLHGELGVLVNGLVQHYS